MNEQRININIMDDEPVKPAAAANSAEENTSKTVYASVAERFVALLIDYGVIFIPCRFVAWIVFKVFSVDMEMEHFLLLIAVMNGLFILYEAIFSCGGRMTLGKSLIGIAVVQKDLEGPIPFTKALLRAIGYYISGGLLMCGFLWAFFDDRHRALHDLLGDSVVVQIREKSWGERALVRVLGFLLLLAFGGVLYINCFDKNSLLAKYHISHARNHLRKIASLEEVHKARYGYYTNDLYRLALLSGDPVQFQRDTQRVLHRRGFAIGVTKDSYKITAVAKDRKKTRVAYSPN